MQHFLSTLSQQAGRQLSASEAKRSAMICWVSGPLFSLFGVWALISHFVIVDEALFNHTIMLPASAYAFTCAALWLALGLVGLRLDKTSTTSPLYTTITLWAYTITSVTACYLIGTLNVVTGLIMMGAPMIGLMLFSLRQVLIIFIAGLGIVLTLSLLSALQIIPYAPILNPQQSASAHLSLYWTLCLILAAGFYVIYQTIIMNAMVNAWRSREESIRSLSETDALTGVANRRHILSILEQLLARKGNSEQMLSVLMVDIDHFKRINDEHGHIIGDRALHATAHALRDCLRNDEIIGRYGGEEFLVLLPDTNSTTAQNIAERCRQAINTLVIDANGAALPLSTSIGLCTRVYGDIRNSDHIIHLADEAMYAAKRAGRNRVIAA